MMATEPQRHITVGSPLSNETTPTRLGLPYASDQSVQKRKLPCRTLYNLTLKPHNVFSDIPPLHLNNMAYTVASENWSSFCFDSSLHLGKDYSTFSSVTGDEMLTHCVTSFCTDLYFLFPHKSTVV
jgi:hypothetical protein